MTPPHSKRAPFISTASSSSHFVIVSSPFHHRFHNYFITVYNHFIARFITFLSLFSPFYHRFVTVLLPFHRRFITISSLFHHRFVRVLLSYGLFIDCFGTAVSPFAEWMNLLYRLLGSGLILDIIRWTGTHALEKGVHNSMAATMRSGDGPGYTQVRRKDKIHDECFESPVLQVYECF